MNRVAINPTDWGLQFGMNQGEVIEGLTRYLHFWGQVALEPDAGDGWIGEAGTMPPQTLLGVNRLVFPELLVEIEATAGA